MRPLDLIDDGLRVSLPDGTTQPLRRYLAPLALLAASAALLVASTLLPYWSMLLVAPQYPDGLHVSVYVEHIEGDVQEIDTLNHYLGLPPLDEGGRIERALALPAILVVALLTLGAALVRKRWGPLLLLPAIGFPLGFLADLWYILYSYGHDIQPTSALGNAIDPFTPPLFGRGQVAQFASIAHAEAGLWLASLAALLALAGLVALHVANAPLQRARERAPSATASARPSERGA